MLSSLSVLCWLRQPSTITGLSAVVAAGAGVASGQLTPSAALPVVVFGAVGMLLPDHTAAAGDARKLAADILAGKGNAANPAPLVADVAALASDLSKPGTPPRS